MSAGNYGKAFAYASKHYGSKGKSFGVEVERVPASCLTDVVNRCVQNDHMTFLHPYDDLDLIAGHASLGLEVLEAVPEPDVVVVCCGGGGLLAGVAAAVRLSGSSRTRIYGVEPEGGTLPYQLCRRHVDQIVLVSDEEIKAAVSALYRSGLVVEPSGAAAFAAVSAGDRIPDMAGKNVVCILSGGNMGKDELANFPD
ncbi:hypothetical protein CRUP_014401 [Coryphaenoides rupestris]|nr:hypothetical protein CRUP_014401 [Coryphaenoides rupestris]